MFGGGQEDQIGLTVPAMALKYEGTTLKNSAKVVMNNQNHERCYKSISLIRVCARE